jgi:hypothetical protein
MLNTRIGYLALISALFISSIAIYFSVAGLAAIFSAYAISIIIMGTAIELGKLAAVVWLHHNWKDKSNGLKAGLSILVLGVMFLTSTGIFGYLSKSHVEQTAQSLESVAQVQRIETEIARYTSVIARSKQKIQSYEDNGSGVDASLNGQIDKEQARIDSAYDRVKPVIQVQLDIIASAATKTEARTKPFQSELTAINQQLADLQTALSNKQIKTAQAIVGTRPDGSYKSKTVAAIADFRTRNEARRDTLLQKIDDIRSTPPVAAKSAQEEITRIRASVQSEINESNSTIKSLRSRMGKSNANDIETLITGERAKIKNSNTELDTLTEEKYVLQAGYRKLEAEVGPIKYIAEFVSDEEADADLLERAVRWLIILIIFIFDPFAILLLIAAQHSFDRGREERNAKQEVEQVEYTMEELLDVPKDEVNHNHEWDFPIPTYSDYFPEDEEELEDITTVDYVDDHPDSDDPTGALENNATLSLIKTAEDYINFNGKVYRIAALRLAHPELNLDFGSPVRSGIEFPLNASLGNMFLGTNSIPSNLFIFNGTNWNQIDKNLLNYTAYSHEYIKTIIKQVGNGEYNPELLNEAEKIHIEELLGREE